MEKRRNVAFGVGILSVGLCVLAGGGAARVGAAEPAQTDPGRTDAREATLAAQPALKSIRVAPKPAAALARARGVVLVPLPAMLASQLRLEPGTGGLVASVEAGSAADGAGLVEHDVIVGVSGEAVDGATLASVLGAGEGVILRVLRGGVPRSVALPAEGENGARFLSLRSLDPDHPFRRLGELRELRESYEGEAGRYNELVRELDQRSRATRQAANDEKEVLFDACMEEVARYLDSEEKRMLARLDEGLHDDRVRPIQELCMKLEKVLPPERVNAVELGLTELAEAVASAPHARIEVTDAQKGSRTVRRFHNLGREMHAVYQERILRVWRNSREDIKAAGTRFAEHDPRMEHAAGTVAAIRAEVRERITCAFDRTAEEFGKSLASGLERMRVPREGEIAGALSDVSLQIERMTERFIRRTTRALEHYERVVHERNAIFGPAADAALSVCEDATAELTRRLGEVVPTDGRHDFALGDDWKGYDHGLDLYHDLRLDLLAWADDGRTAVRRGAREVVRQLEEHRLETETAWRDLRELLSELKNEAADDCWKLDGPHLDGRFPETTDLKDQLAVARRE